MAGKSFVPASGEKRGRASRGRYGDVPDGGEKFGTDGEADGHFGASDQPGTDYRIGASDGGGAEGNVKAGVCAAEPAPFRGGRNRAGDAAAPTD